MPEGQFTETVKQRMVEIWSQVPQILVLTKRPTHSWL